MRVWLDRSGLAVVFRMGRIVPNGNRPAIGFKIKPVSAMLPSERMGMRRGFIIGPVYFGLYS